MSTLEFLGSADNFTNYTWTMMSAYLIGISILSIVRETDKCWAFRPVLANYTYTVRNVLCYVLYTYMNTGLRTTCKVPYFKTCWFQILIFQPHKLFITCCFDLIQGWVREFPMGSIFTFIPLDESESELSPLFLYSYVSSPCWML